MTGSHEPSPVIYHNPLASADDIDGFRLEGSAQIGFPEGRLRIVSDLEPEGAAGPNCVLWCPQELPADIQVTWEFWPLREPGLCILFFAAAPRRGDDLFGPQLARRTGEYEQYHHGDINALHVSYFRRRWPQERAFHTCNLRKSHGFHLVAQGADPIPSVEDAQPPYRVALTKRGPEVAFHVNELRLFHWRDDGRTYGPLLGGGRIGFRQMAPLIAEYANLTVRAADRSAVLGTQRKEAL